MSTTTLNYAETHQSRPIHSSVNRILKAVARPFVQWLRQWKTEHTLSSLSDRELLDIGVDRSEITDLAARLARDPHDRGYHKRGR